MVIPFKKGFMVLYSSNLIKAGAGKTVLAYGNPLAQLL
jgi:hypothetical protein